MPTRKWWASTLIGLVGVVTMWATTGTWDQEETVALSTLATTAIGTWLVPNAPEAAGVSGQPGQP